VINDKQNYMQQKHLEQDLTYQSRFTQKSIQPSAVWAPGAFSGSTVPGAWLHYTSPHNAEVYRDSNKFFPNFNSVPTWTCCSSMPYLRLTTYIHTLFYNEKALLPLQGLPERANIDDSFQERGIGKNSTFP
jgi:hypothetical protein